MSLGLWVFGSLGLWVFGSLGLWVSGLWDFGSLGGGFVLAPLSLRKTGSLSLWLGSSHI